jgi:hypothetical protein
MGNTPTAPTTSATLSASQENQVNQLIQDKKFAKQADVLLKTGGADDTTPDTDVDKWVSPNWATTKFIKKSDFDPNSINLTGYVKTDALAPYAKLTDLKDLKDYQTAGSYAMSSDLASYAKTDVLKNYQTAGSYAMLSDLAPYANLKNYQTAGSYAMSSDLESYAPKAHNHDADYVKVGSKASTNTAVDDNTTWVTPKYVNDRYVPNTGKAASTVPTGTLPGMGTNNTALSDNDKWVTPQYVQAAFNANITPYAKTTDVTTALGPYAKTTDVTTALGPYAKTTDVTTALGPYAKTTDVTTALGPYAKTTDVTTALGPYAKTTDVTTALGPYAKTTDVAATYVTQNSKAASTVPTGTLPGMGTNNTALSDNTKWVTPQYVQAAFNANITPYAQTLNVVATSNKAASTAATSTAPATLGTPLTDDTKWTTPQYVQAALGPYARSASVVATSNKAASTAPTGTLPGMGANNTALSDNDKWVTPQYVQAAFNAQPRATSDNLNTINTQDKTTIVTPSYVSSRIGTVDLSQPQINTIVGGLAETASLHNALGANTTLTGSTTLHDGIVSSILKDTGSYAPINTAFFNRITGDSNFRTAAGTTAAGNTAFRTAVATNLANDTTFSNSVAGNTDFRTAAGTVAAANTAFRTAVASNLVTTPANLTALSNSVAGNTDFRTAAGTAAAGLDTFRTAVASNLVTTPANLTAVTDKLKGDATLQGALNTSLAGTADFRKGVVDELMTTTPAEKNTRRTAFLNALSAPVTQDTLFVDSIASNIINDNTKKALLNSSITDADLKSKLGDAKKTIWCADGVCRVPSVGTTHPQGPDGTLKINQHGIMFGGKNSTGYELNSGQIVVGIHDQDALNIVGLGKNWPNRKIKMWDNVDVAGTIKMADTHFVRGDDWIRLLTNPTDLNSYNVGLAAKNLWAQQKLWVAGRDILAELDALKRDSIKVNDTIGIRNRGWSEPANYLKEDYGVNVGWRGGGNENYNKWYISRL